MNKLSALTGRQLINAPSAAGFQVIRTKGSHHFLRHPDGRAAGTSGPCSSGFDFDLKSNSSDREQTEIFASD